MALKAINSCMKTKFGKNFVILNNAVTSKALSYLTSDVKMASLQVIEPLTEKT